MFFLGTQTTWRIAAVICCIVPIFTAIAICFVPETPYWLLSKGRDKCAMKSLQWLRGWVSEKAVEKEFNELKRYSDNANKCTPCQKSGIAVCSHKEPFVVKAKELMRKRTLKPFCLVLALFAFCQFGGLHGMRPYLIQVFETFDLPIDSNWATVSNHNLLFLLRSKSEVFMIILLLGCYGFHGVNCKYSLYMLCEVYWETKALVILNCWHEPVLLIIGILRVQSIPARLVVI